MPRTKTKKPTKVRYKAVLNRVLSAGVQEVRRGRSLDSSVVDVSVPGEDDRWVPDGQAGGERSWQQRNGVLNSGGGAAGRDVNAFLSGCGRWPWRRR